MAQTFVLGKAGFVDKGAWSGTVSYAFMDVVTQGGGAFLCIQANSGRQPNMSPAYWRSISKGISDINIVATGSTATMTIVFSDNTIDSFNYPTTGVADGTITLAKLSEDFVLPIAQGGTGGTTADEARSGIGAQAQHTARTVTLAAGSWSGTNQQTVTCNGVTASNTVIVAPAPASVEAWGNAGIVCTTQTTNKLTFSCATKPTAAVTVNVVIMEVA